LHKRCATRLGPQPAWGAMSRSVFYGLLAALGFAALAQGEDCNTDTGGTCNIWGCNAERGPAVCTKVNFFRHHCICQEGYCADGGICKSAAETPAPTQPPTPSPMPPPMPLPAPAQPPTVDDVCARAYDLGCYAETPFKSCCHDGKCQSATEGIECNWGLELPCCGNIFKPEDAKFKFNVHEEDFCRRACILLGDEHNSHLDYCPDGKLELMTDVQHCPAALASLKRAVGEPSWCSSHHKMTCHWSYSAFSRELGGLLHVSGQFSFADDNGTCTDACLDLGRASNRPAEYCPTSPRLAASVSMCPQAKASFDSVNARWCEGGAVSLVQAGGRHEIIPAAKDTRPAAARAPAANRSLPSSAASSDELELFNADCHYAFKVGCWKKKPFSDCCNLRCAETEAKYSCSWKFTYNGLPSIGEELTAYQAANGTSEPWAGCDHACAVLATASNNPQWYCHPEKSNLLQQIEQCPQAKSSLMHQSAALRARNNSWCETDLGFLSSPVQSRFDPVIGTAAAAVALAMAAAIAVKFRARSLAGEDGYQPFLG